MKLMTFERIDSQGGRSAVDRHTAAEVPVALEYNGFGYAVLMATPADLTYLVYGFTWTERLVDDFADIMPSTCTRPTRPGSRE